MSSLMPISKILTGNPIIPVVMLDDLNNAVPLADALQAGGIDVIEITLRTEAGLAAIAKLKAERPQMLIGAGTILNKDQASRAMKAGADFLVSPGCTPTLLAWARRKHIAYLPGVATPSEMLLAMEAGFDYVKLFPASVVGGVAMLKAVAPVFPDLSFCPTGGVNAQNYHEYLEQPNVMAIGGSWFVSPEKITTHDWEAIAQGVKKVVLGHDE
jgi:2-dehydro-3-deoxyphosphogluconate aldolase/(4S)-4-hydroxy-2-oxoglutarate aldolase